MSATTSWPIRNPLRLQFHDGTVMTVNPVIITQNRTTVDTWGNSESFNFFYLVPDSVFHASFPARYIWMAALNLNGS
jgi:hypothetical protein